MEQTKEYHCLIECPRFMNERKGFLPVRRRHRPSMYEFGRPAKPYLLFINKKQTKSIESIDETKKIRLVQIQIAYVFLVNKTL